MTNEELLRVLRDGDPAANRKLDPVDAAAMKREILTSIRQKERRTNWQPLLAAAAAMVLFVIAVLVLTHARVPDTASVATQTAAVEPVRPAPESDDTVGVRQIQYTTEGGTRIIWTLDPNFEL